MKKILSILLFSLTLFWISASHAYAWTNGDAGIQTFHQTTVPQINSRTIQDHYTSDSFFPLFLYWYDSNRVPEIAAAGFNTLYSLDNTGKSYEQQMAILAPYHIKFFPLLKPLIAGSINNNLVGLKNWVTANKDNLSVLVWWLTDEASGSLTKDQFLQAYNAIKTIDPNRATMGEQANSSINSIIVCYSNKVDLSYVYSYSVTRARDSMGGLSFALDRYMKLGCPWPYFTLLQAFYMATETGIPGGLWSVMPTYAQIRVQMYTAIVHGATGVGLFPGFTKQDSGERIQGLFPGSSQWAAASAANHEIEANKRIFLSKTSTDQYHIDYERSGDCQWYDNDCSSTNPPVHTMLKDTGESGVRYLLAVDLDAFTVKTQYTFSQNLTGVTSLFDNRAIAPSGKTFTDNMPAYGVNLYRLSFAGSTQTVPPIVLPIPGDINQDGHINILDLRQLKTNFTNIFAYAQMVGNYGK